MYPETDILHEAVVLTRRRTLLPLWIKIFVWLFMIMGAFSVVAYLGGAIIRLLGFTGGFSVALFGLETTEPFSSVGIILFLLFALKGAAAYMLWTKKKNAVNVAILDAVVGITVCLVLMAFPGLRGGGSSIRGEIILLIPYLIKMVSIRNAWLDGVEGKVLS